MNKIIKVLIISATFGIFISLGTYFYQREGGYVGVCVVGQRSPCNGDEFNDRGFPARYINPEGEINIIALAGNIVFWSVIAFIFLKTIDTYKTKK